MPSRPTGVSRRAFQRSLRAILSVVLAGLMMVGSLVLPGLLPSAVAAPPVTDPDPLPNALSVTADDLSVLAGEAGRIRVTATNQGTDQYNASAVVVLPLGVTYIPGSSEPGAPRAVGEPTIMSFTPDPAEPTETQQVLVWPNVADLPQGAELEVSFQVRVDDARYPVGSTVPVVDAGVYANADERVLPDVTVGPAGPSVTDVTSGGAAEAQVTVVPIRLTKTEGDPEAEVYRGPANAAAYQLTVTAAPEGGSDSVVVTDLVPAQFQVTGCTDGCTMEIVTVDGRVYTQLTWDLGSLPAGATRTLTYSAFIGLREITAPDGTPNGAPTRPTGEGYGIVNTATATGEYNGGMAPDAEPDFSVESSFTVRVLDAGIVKRHAGGDFEAGETRTFSLDIRTSEYTETSTLVLTDTISDGLCPVVPDGTPTSGSWPTECLPVGGGTVTGATMLSATVNPNGTFTVIFEVDALGADEDTTVSYDVYMRRFHTTGERTSAGDSFTNTVGLQTQTTPSPGNTVDMGSADMTNGSSDGIATASLSIAKTVWSNPDRRRITGAAGAGDACQSAPAGEYVDDHGPLLQLGDLVCFRITVYFPPGVATRDAILGDFLPPGFELVVKDGAPQWATNEPDLVSQPNPAITRWLLGEPAAGPAPRFVPGGTTVSVDLLTRSRSVPQTQPEVTGNLAKLRYTSAGGTIVAVRDAVDVSLAPPPPLSLEKLAAGEDELKVEEQDVVPFTIAVRHDGTAADGNTYPLDTVEVWDVLPPGFSCSALSAVDPAWASCEVVGGNSVVTWQLAGASLGADNLLTADETVTVSYNLTVPQPLSINTRHTNTAAVTRYTAPNTDGIIPGGAALHPTNPVGAYPDVTKNAPQASDTATIWLGAATVNKQVISTGENVAGNNLTGQATIGESALYQYSVTIPAHTSVFSGVLDDALPTSGALIQTGDPVLFAAPPGVTVDTGCAVHPTEFRLCSDGRLFFPAVYTNDSDADVTFAVQLPVRVADVPANSHGVNVDNVANFHSAPTAGGSPIRQGEASARLSVVEPSPTLTKTSTVTQAEAGQQVTYTLTATNAAGRPPLHDTVVVDCVPGDLVITLPLAAGLSGPVPGDGTNGCPTDTQRLQWTLPSPLVAGAAQATSYTVTVPSSAAAGRQYVNNAALTGSSLPGTPVGERTYQAAANRTITVNNPTLSKSVSPGVIMPGGEATWSITTTLPQNVWLYNATFIDRMPTQFGTAAAVSGWELSCGGGDATWQNDCVTGSVIAASPASDFGVTIDEIASSALPRTLTLTLRATLPTTATSIANNTSVTNTARLRWNHTPKVRPANTAASFDSPNTLTANATTIVRHPSVTVAKAVNDTTVEQGQIVTYTVTATASNAANRNLVAYNVQVVDTVPAGIVVLGAGDVPLSDGASTPSGGVWNATARTLTWSIAELNPGPAPNAQSFAYRARLAPAADLTGAALTNSVRPQSWQSRATDGGTYAPGGTATRAVTPQFPRINAAKTQVSPANPVYIGQEVTFRFVLTNVGGATAVSLDAVDTLPAGWSYVPGSAQVTVRSGTATLTEPSSITGQVLRWNALGGATVNLLPTEQIAVSYRAVASSAVTPGLSVPHVNTVVAAEVTDATGGTSFNAGTGSYIGTSGTADARIALSDVAVTKVANDNFVAGQTGTYTITVRNNGPDPATGVQLVDTVTAPTGVTVLGASGTGWTCAPPVSGQFSCNRTNASDTLAAGASWTLTVNAAVAATVPDGTTIPNQVVVSSTTEDRTTDNNTADATATVHARADLSVTKTAAPSAATAGTPISWTVTLVNNGPSVSRGTAANPIRLSDPLPTTQVSGIAIDSQTAGADCAIAGGTLSCAIAHDLAVGDTVVVTLSGTVNDNVAPGSSIANTATVTPVTTDPTPGNNSGTSTTPTTVQEALTITKVITDPAPPTEPIPGETITYRLQVHNGGPSIARGVYVIDTLPAGLTFDGIVGSGWSATGPGNTVRLDLAGTLAVDATASVEIRARIAASVTGGFTNTAIISSTWRANQDDAAVTTGSNPEADLAIDKSVSPATIVAGQGTGGDYTLVVTNHGPSDAAAPITVTDLLPLGMSVRGTLPTGCTTGDVDDRVQVTCVRNEILAAGAATWTIAIPVLVAADVTATSLVNQATVSSPTPDPDPGNNTSTELVGIAQRASLDVTKTASPDPVTAGEDVTWTIRVTNNGPSDAQSVQLVDPLDSRLVLKSVTPAGANCTGTTTINCALGTLRPAQSIEVTVVTTVQSSVPEGESIANTATATSTTLDPATDAPATDSGTDDVSVEALAQLTIDKQAVTATVDAGGVAVFDVVVGNAGPTDAATNVVVTDTLPTPMTYLAASTIGGPAAWNCAAVGQVVSCRLELAGTPVTLPAGATAPVLRISATVRASETAGTLTNTATAESPSDPTPPSDDAEVGITTHADLGIVKAHAPDAVAVAGESFTWTLTVTNHGPSDSVATAGDPIVVRDVLPDGVSFTSGTGPDTSCEVAGEQDGREIVECRRDTALPRDGSVVITLVVALDQALSGTVTNTATVAPGITPQPDVDLHPDSGDDQVVLAEVADLTIAKQVVTDPVVAGQVIEWQVTVSNLGPSDSDASADDPIRVVDTLPLGVTYRDATGEGWECAPLATLPDGREQLECLRAATLRIGDAPPITVTGQVGSGVRGDVVNTAEVLVGLTPQPPDGEPDEATVTAPVTESADLAIVKTIAADLVAGATGVYRLQITNLGPSDARAVRVVDILPPGLGFVRALPPADGEPAWTCEPDQTDPQQVNCALAGELPAAGTATLDLEVTVERELQGDLENRAEVSSETPDPDLDNNESTVTGTIAERADLSVVKTALDEPVVGGELTYQMQVSNAGPSLARGVRVTDLVPSQLTVISVTAPDDWQCATGQPEAGGTPVTCLLDQLAVGDDPGMIQVVVLVGPDAFPAVSNTAVVGAATPEDPDTLTDNTSTVTNQVPPAVELDIVKELTAPLVAGRNGSYRIVVTNHGPTADPGPITVTDQLPAGLTVRSWQLAAEAGSCEGSGRLLTCTLTGLQVNESVEIDLVVAVASDASGTLVNTATVSSQAFPEVVEASAEGEIDRSQLPFTGASLQALGWAFVLLLAGAALVLVQRRRARL